MSLLPNTSQKVNKSRVYNWLEQLWHKTWTREALEIFKLFCFDILVPSSAIFLFQGVRSIEYSCFLGSFFFFYLPDKTLIYITLPKNGYDNFSIPSRAVPFFITKYEVSTWLYGPGTQVSMQWFWAGFWSYIEIQSIIKPCLFQLLFS